MKNYPFTAILGQDEMKEALILNLINPKLGGVLLRGQKGTAKSTAVRALTDVSVIKTAQIIAAYKSFLSFMLIFLRGIEVK